MAPADSPQLGERVSEGLTDRVQTDPHIVTFKGSPPNLEM